MEEIFPRYGIPVFPDAMTDILQKPVFAVVTGALTWWRGGYSYDDVGFAIWKNSLMGVQRRAVTSENYVLKWG